MTSPVTIHFGWLDLDIEWGPDGTVQFGGVDEELEMVLAALSDEPQALARFMLGIRDAEQRGLLTGPEALSEALAALDALRAWSFAWPKAWGPFDAVRAEEAATQEYRKLVRCLPDAAKVIGLHSTSGRLRDALSDDPVPILSPLRTAERVRPSERAAARRAQRALNSVGPERAWLAPAPPEEQGACPPTYSGPG